jgi:CRISPR-associated protein (TIGR03984 family)
LDWDGAVCRDASGHTPGLSDVFEARLFDGDMELRWLQRDPDGSGDAVVVAEAADRVSAWVDAGDLGMTTRADVSYVDAWDNPYLLWGRRGPEQPDVGGWATFTSARIGSLTVPVAVASGRGAAQLVSREYMALDSAGNAYVVDERLCRFEAAPEPSEGKSGSPGSAGTSGQGVR